MIERLAGLRTPRGIAKLFAFVFSGALAIAVFAAVNRPYFEGLVREKHGPPSMAVERLVWQIEAGAAGAEEVAALEPGAVALIAARWARIATFAALRMAANSSESFKRRMCMTASFSCSLGFAN